MTANPATVFTPPMTSLTGNTGGAVSALPNVTVAGARDRVFIGTLAMASQTSGSAIAVARLPIGAAPTSIEVITDTSTSTATLAFGNSGSGNSAIYGAAAAVTTTNAKQSFCKAATMGIPITAGVDCISGAASTDHEDIVATIGTANLPSSGNLTFIVKYAMD